MSNTVWPFSFSRPYSEFESTETTAIALNNGVESRRAEFGTYGKFTIRGRVRLPMNSQTAADWYTFVRARQGAYDPFLVSAHFTRHNTVTDEAVGTGDGSTLAFELDMKHINESTLVVKVAGSTQTLTTHYTVSGNNTAPTVTFLSAPTGGQAVTATYSYYYPMRFATDELVPRDLHLTGSDSTAVIDVNVTLVETAPGAHRA